MALRTLGKRVMLKVSDLIVSFGSHDRRLRAVDGVSFSVAEGESFGLVGESGSGKSSILRAICGLVEGWEGEIRVAGEIVKDRGNREFARFIQMVFQDPYGSLHPRHTVDRTLREPAAIHGLPERDRRVVQVLEEVGLGPAFRFRYPHQLSGGQRQRVAIARALILEPALLLLDEPTSALDVSVQAEILNLLSRIRRERGLTLLLVSHDLAVIAQMCDRLAVMNHGRIVEDMTAEQLRAGQARQPYTRQLLTASRGYDRTSVAAFQDFSPESAPPPFT